MSEKPVIEQRVYVGNVDYRATPDALRTLFDSYTVKDVDIPSKTTVTRANKPQTRHLGFAFVELATKEEADAAIASLDGARFMRRQVFMRKAVPPPTEEEKRARAAAYHQRREEAAAEKARRQREAAELKKKHQHMDPAEAAAAKVPAGEPSPDTIFITNLDYKASVKTLSSVFKEMRPKWIHVPLRKLPRAEMLKRQHQRRPQAIYNKGIAFVKFPTPEVQKQAIAEFQGMMINGRAIIVDVAINTHIPPEGSEEGAEESESEEGARGSNEGGPTEEGSKEDGSKEEVSKEGGSEEGSTEKKASEETSKEKTEEAEKAEKAEKAEEAVKSEEVATEKAQPSAGAAGSESNGNGTPQDPATPPGPSPDDAGTRSDTQDTSSQATPSASPGPHETSPVTQPPEETHTHS
ncbi:hypothetical protein DICA4_F26720 [Diutina catenulata]